MTPPGEKAGRAVWNEVAARQGLIRGVLINYGAPIERIDDLVQDCMFIAWRAIEEGRFNPPDPTRPLAENVAAWLSGIASRVAIEARRARARRRKVFTQETKEHPADIDAISAPDVERITIAKEELRAIEALKLSPAQREALSLSAQGYTAPEIGRRMGLNENTVYTMLRRARLAYEAAIKRQKARRRRS